jgi:hypothetical protein
VRGSIFLADVRLDLHDPARAPASFVIANETCPDETLSGVEGRTRQLGAIENGQGD